MDVLTEIKFPNTYSYIGTMDYLHLDGVDTTYSFKKVIRQFTSGNGNSVEETCNDYWKKYLTNKFTRNLDTTGYYDFKFEDGNITRLIEVRRFTKKLAVEVGYTNSEKRRKFPWPHKAELLKSGNGGYICVYFEINYMHMFYLPAEQILNSSHGRLTRYVSASKIKEMFGVDMLNYRLHPADMTVDKYFLV